MNKKIGSTTIAKIKNQTDMNRFVKSLDLKSDLVIIKPNWIQARGGTYTDAKVIDMFLRAVKKITIFVESYTFWRTDKYAVGGGDYFSSQEATLKTGKKHWNHFKKQDKWFLSATGIGEVLKKHRVKYLNITNEVWLGDTVDPEEIKAIVEAKYEPVFFKELYSYVPKKLFELRGSDFISFSKAKKEIEYSHTLSTKNFFGLIPDPIRYPKYHGKDEKLLSQTIGDINEIYRSLFNCKFVVEGIFTASRTKVSMEEVNCVKDWGVILGGNNSIEVDMIAAKLLKTEPPLTKIEILEASRKLFGDFDKKLIKQIPKGLEIEY
jgi:uncharacterized protein (DUF362 family)